MRHLAGQGIGRALTLLMMGALACSAGAEILSPEPKLTLSTRIEVGRNLLGLTGDQRRTHAVSLARAERVDSAVRILEAINASASGGQAALHDLLSVLSWQGSYRRVLALAPQLQTQTAPAYVLQAVARSARGVGDFDAAVNWYQLTLTQDPHAMDALAGLALTYADAGRPVEARAAFESLNDTFRNSVRGGLINAYLLRSSGNHPEALTAYDRILDREAHNREALRGKLHTLQAMLLPQQALALAARYPGLADEAELDTLYADRAALWVRWGERSRAQGNERFRDLDEALRLLDANLARFPADSPLWQVTQFDRIVALRARARHEDVVAVYHELGLPDESLPVYVLRSVAGSRLALREPEEARRLYDLALATAGEDFDLNLERFYALVELENHAAARSVSEALVASQAIWRSVPGSRVIKHNPRRLKAEIALALSYAYADQLEAAEATLSDMLLEAPHNTDIRQELANVYRWRGWPRQSLFEYRQVDAVEPELLSAQVGLANALLDLHRGQEFERRFAGLQADYADHPGVRRLARRHELYHRNEIVIDADGGESSGEQFGSRQHQSDARVYLGGTGYRWRPFAQLHDARAEFSEGVARRRRAGLGIAYRQPGHSAYATIVSSLEGDARTGLSAGYGWEVNDRWRFDGLIESASHALPLRAYRQGTDADRLRMSARYRRNETLRVGLSGEAMDFSDGNFRTAWLLDASRRILNRPAWKIDLTGNLFASANDRSDVGYFSPSSDRSISLGIDSRWRLYRRYERSFEHRLLLNAGRYTQSGFAGGNVGSIEYQHILQLSEALQFHYGLRRVRALYDGTFEYGTFFTGGLRGRF